MTRALARIPQGALVLPVDASSLNTLRSELGEHVDQVNLCLSEPIAAGQIQNHRTAVLAPPRTGWTQNQIDQVALRYKRFAPVVVVGGSSPHADVTISHHAAVEVIGDGFDKSHITSPVITIGDVHNCHRTLSTLLTKLGIFEDLTESSPLPVLLGDLVDKGGSRPHDAVETYQLVRTLVRQGRILVVRGNHDHQLGRRLGGDLEGLKPALRRTVDAFLTADPERDTLVPEAQRFMNRLPLALRLPGGVTAVHASFNEAAYAKATRPDASREAKQRFEASCLYGPSRKARNWAAQHTGGPVVHGHVVVEEPRVANRVVDVDTGCYRGGALTGWWIDQDPTSPGAYLSVPADPGDIMLDETLDVEA